MDEFISLIIIGLLSWISYYFVKAACKKGDITNEIHKKVMEKEKYIGKLSINELIDFANKYIFRNKK